MSAAVTLCIPAYRAAAFLAATIDSALAQTWPAVEIVVSIDPCDDGTAEIAEGYARRGVRVVRQPVRGGWIGNTNAAFTLADTPYAMYLPHDDIIHPRYVEACMAALDAHPEAVLAYSDVIHGHFFLGTEPSVFGSTERRADSMLRNHFSAQAMRGVFDRRRAQRHLLPDFAVADYAADTLWIARMLCQGAMVRVPRPLYSKRAEKTSVYSGWLKATPTENEEMWVVHCLELRRLLLDELPPDTWSEALEAAWRYRTLERREFPFGHPPAGLDPSQPLLPQAEAVMQRVLARKRPYGWAAGRSRTAAAE